MGISQTLVISVIAFALGYQTRSYFASRTISAPAPTQPVAGKARSKARAEAAAAAGPTLDSTPISPRTSSSSSEGSVDTDSDDEDLALALGSNPQSLSATAFDEVKLVLVVNDSLKMSKGKIAAQAGHATLACAELIKDVNGRMFRHWQRHGQPKIALRCADDKELEELAAQARRLNLCARIIQDAGRTQVAAGSKTILGIGPGPAKIINQVTGKLKLL